MMEIISSLDSKKNLVQIFILLRFQKGFIISWQKLVAVKLLMFGSKAAEKSQPSEIKGVFDESENYS